MKRQAVIYDFLRAHPDWHTSKDIAAVVPLTTTAINGALAGLYAKDRVQRERVEVNRFRWRIIEVAS